jgi:predicted DNA-binding protein
MILQEKLGVKITVLFPKRTDIKLNEICIKTERPKSNLIRKIVSDWVEKVVEKG